MSLINSISTLKHDSIEASGSLQSGSIGISVRGGNGITMMHGERVINYDSSLTTSGVYLQATGETTSGPGSNKFDARVATIVCWDGSDVDFSMSNKNSFRKPSSTGYHGVLRSLSILDADSNWWSGTILGSKSPPWVISNQNSTFIAST
jgi:hypothetical protein